MSFLNTELPLQLFNDACDYPRCAKRDYGNVCLRTLLAAGRTHMQATLQRGVTIIVLLYITLAIDHGYTILLIA